MAAKLVFIVVLITHHWALLSTRPLSHDRLSDISAEIITPFLNSDRGEEAIFHR